MIVIHPSAIARMSLRDVVEWAMRLGFAPSNVRSRKGNHYLMLEHR